MPHRSLEQIIEIDAAKLNEEEFAPPKDLAKRIRAKIQPGVALSWDQMVTDLAKHHVKRWR
jgi:hypothetical protein